MNYANRIKGLKEVYVSIKTVLDLRKNDIYLRNRERDNSYTHIAVILEEQAKELIKIAEQLRAN